MKTGYKYVAYVFAGEQVWRVSTNSKERAREYARKMGADSYALLYKHELKCTADVPAGYVRAHDGWCKQWYWTNAIPEKFKPEDGGEYAIHHKMEANAEEVEL